MFPPSTEQRQHPRHVFGWSGGLLLPRVYMTQTLLLANHFLVSYFRSGWLVGELVVTGIGYLVFLSDPSTTSPEYLYGAGGVLLGGIAVVGTAVLLRRELQDHGYLTLAKLTSRSAYAGAVALASIAVRLGLLLVLITLYVSFHRVPLSAWLHVLVGGTGVLSTEFVLVSLTLALLRPIGTRTGQIAVLAWLVAALVSYQTSEPLSTVLMPLRWPLLPLFAAASLGTSTIATPVVLLASAVCTLYAIGLTYLALRQFTRRDLSLH